MSVSVVYMLVHTSNIVILTFHPSPHPFLLLPLCLQQGSGDICFHIHGKNEGENSAKNCTYMPLHLYLPFSCHARVLLKPF